MTPIKPRRLGPGSHIRIVSPASNITPEQTEDGIKWLENEGYQVTLGENVYTKFHYLAGTDEQRAGDFMAAIDDPSVDAIMCSRGGYGCARLMPMLDFDKIAASRKAICGFSDVTTLHLALQKRGAVSLHTPMLITLSVEREPWVMESLSNCLKGENPIPETAKKGDTLVGGTAEGVVEGGCLCLLTDSFHTDYEIDWSGKIVVIEDVDENPHRIDAMFTNLVNNGYLAGAAGIVIGEMTGTDERSDEKIGRWPWREIIADRIAPLGIPAIVNFPFGHMRTMLSLPLGVRARLDADSGTLTYLEPHMADA